MLDVKGSRKTCESNVKMFPEVYYLKILDFVVPSVLPVLVCWGFLILYLSRLLPVPVPCRAGHRSLLIDSESFSGKLQLWPSDTGTRATTASPGREPSIKLPLCPDLYSLHVCVSERQCVFGGWALFGGGLGSYLPWPQADCSPRGPWRQCQGEVNRTISTCKSIPRDPGALAPSPPPLPPLAKHPFRGGPSAIMSLLTSLATPAGRYLRGGEVRPRH